LVLGPLAGGDRDEGVYLTGVVLAFSSGALAAQPTSFETAMADLDGVWSGALTYRDYRTDKRVQIPLKREIKVSPDGAFALIQSTYTDPGYKVYGGELIAIRADGLSGASTGGGGLILDEHQLTEFEATEGGWFAVLTGRGSDNDQPADRRSTWRVEGDELTVTNAYKVDGEDDFKFRNSVSLTLTEASE
jgi:hypothetical protein